MTYQELKAEHQAKLTKVMDDNQIFWAFNDEQLTEGMEKHGISKDNKMTSIGMGGYMPVKNLESYLKDSKELETWYKAEMKAIKQKKAEMDKAIAYELSNHECFFSGDINPACEALPEISRKDILRVWKKKMRS